MFVAILFRAEMPFGIHRLAAVRANRPAVAGNFGAPAAHRQNLRARTPEPHNVGFFGILFVSDNLARYQDNLIVIGFVGQA